jgi:transcriptional regulator with XRE-family HTH domain
MSKRQTQSGKARKQRCVTQELLAKTLKCSETHLNYVLNGHRQSASLMERARTATRAFLGSGYDISPRLNKQLFQDNFGGQE